LAMGLAEATAARVARRMVENCILVGVGWEVRVCCGCSCWP
jgi:hypothetical protein